MLNKLMTKVKEAQKEYKLAANEADNAPTANDKARNLYYTLNDISIKKRKQPQEAEENLLKFVKN